MNEDCERIRAALVGACCNEDGLDSCDGQHAIYALDRVEQSLAAARREVETVNEEAERQAGVICNLNTDLATSRAALEDVRRVVEYVPIHFNSHVYREAILRALAQEAGDAK